MKKNRGFTEQRLITAVEELIVEDGFEKLGVNAVARKTGVDKKLIYRYFGSLDGLVYECLNRQDFWSNAPVDIPESVNLKDYARSLFRQQIVELRGNDILKRLLRWELSNDNDFLKELRKQREENGLARIKIISDKTKIPFEELANIASIITGAISYFVMLEETCMLYNGINLRKDDGWERLSEGVNKIIDLIYNENGN